ncbi:MAG TPA: rod shape-determining protein MreD [Firmicutes bacterium]|jgi:rod shape-determining protein MreD|nr:rod shape-determining protein MreD [Bacillota bacterium]
MTAHNSSDKLSLKAYLVFIFFAVIILLIEGSFFSFLFSRGTIPDLLLIFVVCLAFLWGEKKGIVLGLIGGFLQDLFFGPAIGFFTLAKMAAACFSGFSSREIYKDQVIGPMLTVFLSTFVHEFVVFSLVGIFWGNRFSFFFALDQIFLPKALYHLVLTILIYPLLYQAEQRRFFSPVSYK